MEDEREPSRQISTHQSGANAVAAASNDTNSIMQSFMAMASDPNVDATKMEQLVKLQMMVMDRVTQEEFNKAKIAALREMPVISKRGAITMKGGGVQSRYSKFEDIMRVVKPILDRHNLVLSFDVGSQNNMVTVTPILAHSNGFVERGGTMQLPLDSSGSKNGTQGSGSSASYGKRHTCKAMLNIVEEGEDNDGVSNVMLAPEEWQEQILNEGQKAATGGIQAYTVWYREQTNMQRGWLMDSGEHDKLKAAAANFGP
jgi:hypothetical protein